MEGDLNGLGSLVDQPQQGDRRIPRAEPLRNDPKSFALQAEDEQPLARNIHSMKRLDRQRAKLCEEAGVGS